MPDPYDLGGIDRRPHRTTPTERLTMNPYSRALASHLKEFDVPEALSCQLDFGATGTWPPRPGCGPSPDRLALARTWARLDLNQWVTEAPQAFGPHRAGELDGLVAVGAALHQAGEGAQVLWGLDLVDAHWWTDHDSPGLAVAGLVCSGPRLSDRLVNDVDSALKGIGWAFPADTGANQPCIINRTPCFHTTWHEGNSVTEHPTDTWPSQRGA